MRLSPDKVKKACQRRDLTLGEAIDQAGVSRTAYYSLLRKGSVLPRSVLALADFLEVEPGELLERTVHPELRTRRLLGTLERILVRNPSANRENVWHTLLLLDEAPVDRLERGLLRGTALDFHN